MNTLKAGDKAPSFSLQDHNGEQVNLADYQGKKVIVYFYPKAMTPGCTVQAQGLRDHADAIKAAGAVVFGISPDPVAKLKKFVDKESLNFQLLSDEDHSVADAFGVWGLKKFMGKEYDGIHRITFIIDESGQVEQVLNKFKTKEHHQTVLDALN
ncbi:thioredoxin-dependent thiol peroxidase [Glaciecola sp. XM2]|uniref:thioredoxin-dependent thiol peroxidase n=1 Tax=Glaciecola sp. XM2 TaxID=1914931 RepID=UPI001BDE1B7D|nr:thioredoxin-dependent thiol peroxidase [Glaciecola sp. XM2]MBT1449591.1 thioredoxin-dependent thiol peroxidase [Glaciecola sp. XM2]